MKIKDSSEAMKRSESVTEYFWKTKFEQEPIRLQTSKSPKKSNERTPKK